jgi:hypothetical protein
MLGHHFGDGVALRLVLQLASDPCTLGPGEQRVHAGFVFHKRPIVQVGRVMEVARVPGRVDLHVERRHNEVAATGQQMWCSYQREIPTNKQFFKRKG